MRQKGRETATALEQERLGVLGDGGRRVNTTKSENLKSSTQAIVSLKAGSLSSSTGVGGKRDLNKADGIGPRGVAKGSKAWR